MILLEKLGIKHKRQRVHFKTNKIFYKFCFVTNSMIEENGIIENIQVTRRVRKLTLTISMMEWRK